MAGPATARQRQREQSRAGGADGRPFPRSAGYTGRSLLPLLRGERTAAEHRTAAFSEYHRFGIGQHRAGGCYPIRCVRTTDWKLAINLLDRDELYDLCRDPGETVNLIAAAEHAAVRNELHDLLLAHMDETGDLLAGPGWARRPWRGLGCRPSLRGLLHHRLPRPLALRVVLHLVTRRTPAQPLHLC